MLVQHEDVMAWEVWQISRLGSIARSRKPRRPGNTNQVLLGELSEDSRQIPGDVPFWDVDGEVGI